MNKDTPDDDQPVTAETLEANRRHDAERHSITMDPRARIRSRNVQTAVLGPLTDRKIKRYEDAGYYSQAFREARRKAWNRNRSKRLQHSKPRREGDFLVLPDGRMIFSPR